MVIKRTFTGAPWEKAVGYCRAVRSGSFIAISGTTSVNPDGSVHGAGEAYQQALRCFELIEKALNELHTNRKSIVRTRMFVTDISNWKEFGRAHAEFFADNPPATSMIEVKALINSQLLIEVEADAVD